MYRTIIRTIEANRSPFIWVLKVYSVVVLVVALASCAATRLGTNQSIITDSTTLRQVQRMADVAVPGDSSSLSTRLVFDETTGGIKPVTIYTRSAHGLLALSVDAFGLVTATAVRVPFLTQVPVTDTELTRSHTSQVREVVPVKAPLTGFLKFCIGFTILAFALLALWLYLQFFTPFRLFK
ncbi:hypothetical protein [Hymenobacter glacieicola]|uniref:Uncharacterized protein n=1 Tax=Hymenobacter glacieicola TaxID=1562124 RepID=A0ABQ1WJR9_9BACT|nr:hypothetical protein [Hymenobacter glacieicola]GGG33366.1 hypothetical protein GCM10011378_07300 [Hymenobacter glacieicola]